MKYLKRYNQINEEVLDLDVGFELTNIFDVAPKEPESPQYKRLKEIAKQGNLYKYLARGNRNFTFGMLKAIHKDAMEFKKRREYTQGIEKFLIRAIPLALAPFFYPIWLISIFLGSSRALNKIILQLLKMDNKTYNSFIMNIVDGFINLTEGEIQRMTKDDWFYKSFAVSKGLIRMVRKEHIIEFAFYISKKISNEDDNKIVPPYYVENEFRKWLNRKFRFQPPLTLKRKKRAPENLGNP